MPVVYLRFLPLQLSFISTHQIWTPLAQVKNLGFRVKNTDQNYLLDLQQNPMGFAPLKEFMRSVFQIEEYGALLHMDRNQVQGVSVVFNKLNIAATYPEATLSHLYFESIYTRNEFSKILQNENSTDQLTQLRNKSAFEEEVRNELSRSRRIHRPLAIMKIQVDQVETFREKYGADNYALVLKAFAKSMKKNFRTTDILGRTGESEFCFLLPHTEIQFALIKAEKIRRAFLQSRFPFVTDNQVRLSLSIGVSEYPSLSSDYETLMKSCDDSLEQVRRSGGDRVAAWQATAGFKPDFTIKPELLRRTTRNIG